MLAKNLSTCLRKNTGFRFFHDDILKPKIKQLIPEKLAEVEHVKKVLGQTSLGSVYVPQVYSGMRGIKCMIHETSHLDPDEGIRFRGLTVAMARKRLPKYFSEEPLPEGMFWFLLTGEIPSQENIAWLSDEWRRRSIISPRILDLIDKIPPQVHPMAQLSIAVNALSYKSKFAQRYNEGSIKKTEYWEYVYEDCMDLIAKLPQVASRIYRNLYEEGLIIEPLDKGDWAKNYCHMLGMDSDKFFDYMRLYLVLHCDHEGGNVSAHAHKLVSSALSDPYLAFSACVNGLAGPLHGRANQEVVEWLEELINDIGYTNNISVLTEYCRNQLTKGVIPGYGHAVLRKADPRFSAFLDFATTKLPKDKGVLLVKDLYSVIPDILQSTGKVKNPYPNVDAITGTVFKHFKFTQKEYFTVPFAVSRALGVSASVIWDRIFGFPIERPKSVTTEELLKLKS